MKSVFILLVMIGMVSCDLPVHCLKHQIVGSWRLELSEVMRQGPGPVTCGHEIPDNQITSLVAGMDSFKAVATHMVVLDKDNTVRINGQTQGKWTMVYDEGFDIKVNDFSFFAFSKYLPDEKEQTISSYCGETLIGWYTNHQTNQRGCYRAIKKGSSKEKSESATNAHVVQPVMLEVDHDEIVKRINGDTNNKWKAKVYDEMPYLNQLRRKIFTYMSFTEVERNYKNFSVQDLSDLPKAFSWQEHLGPVKEQHDCGSCYVLATAEMISTRLRIQGNKDAQVSAQQLLDCNYYNQGCDGGYPFLVNKFASEQLLVDEKVYPYKGKGECNEDIAESQKLTYQVRKYRFIGGAYGESNEREIMVEVYNHGPVVLSFEPDFDFVYYESGVYHSTQAAKWIRNNDARPEWEKVDHSVLCYGWGEEDGEKYWLLQNSWGHKWGENGRFRMRRGTDESAIESMGEAAEPVVVMQNNQNQQHQQQDPSFLALTPNF